MTSCRPRHGANAYQGCTVMKDCRSCHGIETYPLCAALKSCWPYPGAQADYGRRRTCSRSCGNYTDLFYRSTRPRLRPPVSVSSRRRWTPSAPRPRLPASARSRELRPRRPPCSVRRRRPSKCQNLLLGSCSGAMGSRLITEARLCFSMTGLFCMFTAWTMVSRTLSSDALSQSGRAFGYWVITVLFVERLLTIRWDTKTRISASEDRLPPHTNFRQGHRQRYKKYKHLKSTLQLPRILPTPPLSATSYHNLKHPATRTLPHILRPIPSQHLIVTFSVNFHFSIFRPLSL